MMVMMMIEIIKKILFLIQVYNYITLFAGSCKATCSRYYFVLFSRGAALDPAAAARVHGFPQRDPAEEQRAGEIPIGPQPDSWRVWREW